MKRIAVIAVLLFCCVLPASASAASTNDRVVVVGDVLVDRGQTAGDVLVADGDVTVRGTVDGDLVVADGDVTIRGKVTGDVVTLAGTAILGRRAQVEGDVVYADKKPQIASGSKVGGEVRKIDAGDIGTGLTIAIWIAITVSTLVLGLLLLLLFPKATDAIGRTFKAKTGMTALVGVLAFILLPVIGVGLLLTLVGIPLGVGLLLICLPLYGLGYTVSAFAIGRLILAKSPRIPAFLLGLVLLRGLAIVPYAGELVGIVATVLGLGAVVLTALRSRR
ncbi:MAG TPA: polymer-forming cytoskeletal protein [Solirubrobacteraceae bacterium]|nr:polymer-forming cytoskeletal protein [Solirubrobacteraceae bacterium]